MQYVVQVGYSVEARRLRLRLRPRPLRNLLQGFLGKYFIADCTADVNFIPCVYFVRDCPWKVPIQPEPMLSYQHYGTTTERWLKEEAEKKEQLRKSRETEQKREKRIYDEQTDYKPDQEDAKLEWMLCGALPRGESKNLFHPSSFHPCRRLFVSPASPFHSSFRFRSSSFFIFFMIKFFSLFFFFSNSTKNTQFIKCQKIKYVYLQRKRKERKKGRNNQIRKARKLFQLYVYWYFYEKKGKGMTLTSRRRCFVVKIIQQQCSIRE